MNIYREVVNRIEIPALPSLENGYYLLRFERNGTTSNVYAVVENESGMGVPITASVTEIGTGTPDPEAGEVLLAPGAWTLFFYEQVSGTNTNPDCSTIPLGQTEVTVYGEDAAVLSQTPTACPSGPGGGITSVNGDTGPAVQLDAVDIPSTPFVSLQSGSFPGAYRDTGFTVEGAPMYKLVGAAGDPDDGLNSIFRQTPTAWVITNATGLEMYNGTGADLLTATWTNTGSGALPLPSLVGIEATDVQAAVEEVAGEVAARPVYKEFRGEYSGLDSDPPVFEGGYNELGSVATISRTGAGVYQLNFAAAVLTEFLTTVTAQDLGNTLEYTLHAYRGGPTRVNVLVEDSTDNPADPANIAIGVRIKQ
jgi:hypothetical protein